MTREVCDEGLEGVHAERLGEIYTERQEKNTCELRPIVLSNVGMY